MNARWGLTVLLVSALMVGCGDMSSPKSTVASLAKALKAGDKSAARATFNIKSENEGKAIDAMMDVVIASQKLQSAAEARFGQAAKGEFANDAPMAGIDKMLAEAAERITGNEATVGDMKLTKVDGKWRITPDGEMKSAMVMPLFNALAKAMGELTGEINAGKYKTIGDAKAALKYKMMRFMLGM
jgi:hypothetical protein